MLAPVVLIACTAGGAIGVEPPARKSGFTKALGTETLEVRAATDGERGQADGSERFRIETIDLASSSGGVYRIFLAIPAGPPPADGFPVFYMLDANTSFDIAVKHLNEQLTSDESAVEPAVIVGIGYPVEGRGDFVRRAFDLTTPASPENLPPGRDGRPWPPSGGADDFLAFVCDDVKALVEKKVTVDRSRQSLYGHSFGGLFVLHAMLSRPDAFQTYIAASPSVWWDDYAVAGTSREFAERRTDVAASSRLLITVGELELRGDEGPAAALPATDATRAFGNTSDFARRLSKAASEKLRVDYHEFAGESHGSVIPHALKAGLQFALRSDSQDP